MDECKPLVGGGGARPLLRLAGHRHGRAVRVDPIKPTLKAPGTKRLNLEYDEVLSNVAFDINMRLYTMEPVPDASVLAQLEARRCTLKP